MFKNHFARLIFILAFLLCGVVSADETGVDTTAASGGNQIIVSPLNILLDLGESASTRYLTAGIHPFGTCRWAFAANPSPYPTPEAACIG